MKKMVKRRRPVIRKKAQQKHLIFRTDYESLVKAAPAGIGKELRTLEAQIRKVFHAVAGMDDPKKKRPLLAAGLSPSIVMWRLGIGLAAIAVSTIDKHGFPTDMRTQLTRACSTYEEDVLSHFFHKTPVCEGTDTVQ